MYNKADILCVSIMHWWGVLCMPKPPAAAHWLEKSERGHHHCHHHCDRHYHCHHHLHYHCHHHRDHYYHCHHQYHHWHHHRDPHCRHIKSAKGWVLSCPPNWLALVIKTPTWDLDHLLDSDYHLDQFYPSSHPPHPQKKACWCRSQELRDTNDSWTSDEATQHFWILHTGAEKDLWHAGHCSLERDAYYIVGQQRHYITGEWKAVQICGDYYTVWSVSNVSPDQPLCSLYGHFAYGPRYYGHYIITATLQCYAHNSSGTNTRKMTKYEKIQKGKWILHY